MAVKKAKEAAHGEQSNNLKENLSLSTLLLERGRHSDDHFKSAMTESGKANIVSLLFTCSALLPVAFPRSFGQRPGTRLLALLSEQTALAVVRVQQSDVFRKVFDVLFQRPRHGKGVAEKPERSRPGNKHGVRAGAFVAAKRRALPCSVTGLARPGATYLARHVSLYPRQSPKCTTSKSGGRACKTLAKYQGCELVRSGGRDDWVLVDFDPAVLDGDVLLGAVASQENLDPGLLRTPATPTPLAMESLA